MHGHVLSRPGRHAFGTEPKTPAQVGLNSGIQSALQNAIKSYPAGSGYAACTLPTAARWALWRHGRLVLYRGSLTTNTEIKSARKSIHAATIGALIQMGKIDADQTLSHNVMDIWKAQPSSSRLETVIWMPT